MQRYFTHNDCVLDCPLYSKVTMAILSGKYITPSRRPALPAVTGPEHPLPHSEDDVHRVGHRDSVRRSGVRQGCTRAGYTRAGSTRAGYTQGSLAVTKNASGSLTVTKNASGSLTVTNGAPRKT